MNSIPLDSVKWIPTNANLVWIFHSFGHGGFFYFILFLCRAQHIAFLLWAFPLWMTIEMIFLFGTEKQRESLKENRRQFDSGREVNILGFSVTFQCFLTSSHEPEIRPNYSRFPHFCQALLAALNSHTLVLKVLAFGSLYIVFWLKSQGRISLTCSAHLKTWWKVLLQRGFVLCIAL